ncbi:MAG: Asp-tRNA(Asn)/Glu-tRNA(Gln) amidotransferase subunit GatB, partial [Desulfovibrionaceae bacterium]|nr:Asp-tRNA(Asn)/Glu-tRNA(Gln) amidotransferase subunit GatB [Desulfovibrionaceae bacterium]
VTKRIGITRIHMENDAGKNIHAQGENASYVDLNRAGTPLVEIVSEPDMRSAAEAVAYLKTLYGIVTYLGVCDGNMEEGSFRCDANVSLRPRGAAAFGTRTELKNLNSFRNVQRAIEYEIARQQDVLDDGEAVVQETRLYDAGKNITASMRSKEEAHDYRYFPDPDILPVEIAAGDLEKWRAELPELPRARAARFMKMTGLPEAEVEVLVQSKALADFFEEAADKADARKVAAYVLGALLRECNARDIPPHDPSRWAMKPDALAELVTIVDKGLISAKIANDIFGDLLTSGAMPEAYVKEKG